MQRRRTRAFSQNAACACFAAIVCSALAPSRSAAQSASPSASSPTQDPNDEVTRRARARDLFERGAQELAAGHSNEAIRLLEAAREIRATPAVHFNLGLAYRQAGRSLDALASFRRYLEDAGPDAPAARIDEAGRYAREIEATLARVRFHTEPRDATVELDGSRVAAADAWNPLAAGRHVVSVSRSGYRSHVRTIDVRARADSEVNIRLARNDDAARLIVETDRPTSVITVDDFEVGRGRADVAMPPGRYHLQVRFGGDVERREITLGPGTVSQVRVDAPASAGVAQRPWFWVIVGSAAAVSILVPVVVAWPRTVAPVLDIGDTPPVSVGMPR